MFVEIWWAFAWGFFGCGGGGGGGSWLIPPVTGIGLRVGLFLSEFKSEGWGLGGFF